MRNGLKAGSSSRRIKSAARIMLPLYCFQMPLNIARRLEAGENQGVFQTSNDVFHHFGLLRVVFRGRLR